MFTFATIWYSSFSSRYSPKFASVIAFAGTFSVAICIVDTYLILSFSLTACETVYTSVIAIFSFSLAADISSFSPFIFINNKPTTIAATITATKKPKRKEFLIFLCIGFIAILLFLLISTKKQYFCFISL